MEVDVAKGRRDWAFSERDKVKYRKIFYYMNNYLHAFKHLEKSAFSKHHKRNNIIKILGGTGKGIYSYIM